jgi:hypothetical protein
MPKRHLLLEVFEHGRLAARPFLAQLAALHQLVVEKPSGSRQRAVALMFLQKGEQDGTPILLSGGDRSMALIAATSDRCHPSYRPAASVGLLCLR